MGIFLKEFTTLNSTVKSFLLLFYLVVEHCEHPDLSTLEPHELIRVENASIAVEACEISTVLMVLRFLQPERKHIV